METSDHPTTPEVLRIFVVENHRDTRELLQEYLEMLGHTVLTADTMTEALNGLTSACCDVLISDIGLPDGDGWQLLQKLPAPKPPYAIAMSGFGMGTDHLKSHVAGYRHHFLKPIDTKQLDAALAEAVRELSATRQLS